MLMIGQFQTFSHLVLCFGKLIIVLSVIILEQAVSGIILVLCDYVWLFVFFVVHWRYRIQVARSYGIMCSQPVSCSQVLLQSSVTPDAESVGGVTMEQVRTLKRVHYKPNAHKRLKKHGLQKRLSSRNGIKMLWRRYLKGRTSLSTWVDLTYTLYKYIITVTHQCHIDCDT